MTSSAVRQPCRALVTVLTAIALSLPLASGVAGAHGKNKHHTATVTVYAEGLIDPCGPVGAGQILKIGLHNYH
ncbi:MAG: hypothetical protein WB812_13295 [Woeseiaceae bacterium]